MEGERQKCGDNKWDGKKKGVSMSRKIAVNPFGSRVHQNTVATKTLATGIYIVKATTNKGFVIKKIIL